ncbi:MAG: hypothetical protein CMI60_17360 [Parvibaculum sp.]|nr:hypothetical protein [Parvibaculum sp.]
MYYRIKPRYNSEGEIENYGIADAKQYDINGFPGNWVEGADGFGVGDWYSETDGWSHPIKTTEEQEAEAREWRDEELRATDFIVPTTDYPNHAAWITYRQTLRDWTTTDDFPATKPTKP